jgi:hypothetical protein
MIYFFNYTIGPYHIARYNQVEKLIPKKIVFVELASRVSIYPWASTPKEFYSITLFPDKIFEAINQRKSLNY